MAANLVAPGRTENGVVTEATPNVKDIQKEWSVLEDGALAHKLQEEENTTHYSGNISRRRTVRSDIRTAKSAADEEAMQAFREEHEIAEKNRQRELEDKETAFKLHQDMIEEEKRKMRELRQRENEERDRQAAKELYQQMMEDEKRKHRQQKSFEETDEELAQRLQAHEERKQRILSQRHHSLEQEAESERLARHLAREEQRRSQPQRVEYDPADDSMHRQRRKHDDKHSEPRVRRQGPGPTDPKSHSRRHAEPQQTDRQRPPESGGQTDTPRSATYPWGYLYKPRQKQDGNDKPTDRSESRDAEKPLEPPGRRKKKPRAPEHREQTHRPRETDRSEYRDGSRNSEVTPQRRPAEPEPVYQEPLEPPERRQKHRSSEPRETSDKPGEKDYLMPNVAGLRVAVGEETVSELPARKHQPQRMPRQHSAPAQTGYRPSDSDEETDVIALIQDDEELARRLQREEIQRSRTPSQRTEQQKKQLIHDQKIAIKMQHEEVMFSKKKTYDNYMGKVKDEIADPEPMVHVSRLNKTPVPVDAKYAEGVQLTDYSTAEAAQQRRTSGSGQAGAGADGNILASIDPTFNRADPGNVVLLKKSSLGEEPTPRPGEDGAFNAVQGSKRKESKEKGKRGSIFSKLKKK